MKINKILHLSTDFQYQTLYNRLVSALNEKKVEQYVYIQRRRGDTGSYDYPGAEVYISDVYKWWMKLLFGLRVKVIARDLLTYDVLQFKPIIYAYFLFTDGAVAHQLKSKANCKYVVFIRNTDFSLYLNFRPWMARLARKILLDAEYVVFVSPSYIPKLRAAVGNEYFDDNIAVKARVIGNIIDDRWFDKPRRVVKPSDTLKLLYVGEFSKNKRLESLIDLVQMLNRSSRTSLTLVGNYGSHRSEIQRRVHGVSYIDVVDRVEDVDKLIDLVDLHHIFVMPSKYETFGNVYVEAMARGLPVIYSQGQGIDGYFAEGEVGYSVMDADVEQMASNVQRIFRRYDEISEKAAAGARRFKSEAISQQYLDLAEGISV